MIIMNWAKKSCPVAHGQPLIILEMAFIGRRPVAGGTLVNHPKLVRCGGHLDDASHACAISTHKRASGEELVPRFSTASSKVITPIILRPQTFPPHQVFDDF